MVLTFRFLLIAIFLSIVKSGTAKAPIVQIPSGTLQGGHQTSLNNRPYLAFEAIPYAEPPTGLNRFQPPIKKLAWNGTLKADKLTSCIQYNEFSTLGPTYKVTGQEDCLHVNVYTPTLTPGTPLPVIVFIHGGGFQFGSGGGFGPKYILDKDVVYVNLNYRLGPMGFLCTEDKVVSGNMGIRDQLLALEWVRDNVKHFGGNPNEITLTGMSAGGASVHLHMLSPLSKGLFQRGLSQSGTALNHWVLAEASLQKARKLASGLDCNQQNIAEAIECLQEKPAEDIVASVHNFQPFLYDPFTPFGVVVDQWAEQPVLPEHPLILMRQGKVMDVPWILSHTNSEGLYPGADFYYDNYLKEINTRWNDVLPAILDFNYTVRPALHRRTSKLIRTQYMRKKAVTKATFNDFIQILTDRMFISDIVKTVRLHAKIVKSPVRFYYFTFRGTVSLSTSRSSTNKDFGAAHSDDMSYLFQNNKDTPTTALDRRMIAFMVNMVYSYASSGAPAVGIEWPVVGPSASFKRLHIAGPENVFVDEDHFTNATFWNRLPIRENEKLFE